MTYGLKINGTDGGGDFIVADSTLNMVNYRVIMSGRAHSISLPGGLKSGDFVFVKSPGGIGMDVGEYEPYEYRRFQGQATITDYIIRPIVFHSAINSSGDVYFYGVGLDSYTSDQYAQGGGSSFHYGTFDVEMDYFVIRLVSDIEDSNQFTNDQYGLRILTEAGTTAFDSRSLITNDVFSIETVLEPSNEWTRQGVSSLSFSAGSYVNIEWSARGAGDLYGLSFNSNGTGIEYIDASEEEYQDGNTTLWYYQNWDAIFAARLESGGFSGGGGGGSNGTLSIASNTTTEPNSVSFNANTNTSGNYHVRLFQLSGNADDYTYPGVGFTGTSNTVTFYSKDVNTSRTITVESIVNYTRQSTSSQGNNFTRGFSATRNSSYTGNYLGDFTRNDDFIGNYSRNFLGSRTSTRNIYYGASYVGNFAGEVDKIYTRTGYYQRNYIRYRPATYEGNYSRFRNSSFTRTSTRGRPATIDYQRFPTATYIGDYARESDYTVVRTVSYEGAYTRNRVSSYSRTRSVSGTQSYAGDYAGNFLGNYVGIRSYDRNFTRNFDGNYNRNISYEGNYTRAFLSYRDVTTPYQRTSTRTRPSGFVRESTYSRTSTRNYEGVYAGNYVGNFSRGFLGNYTRTVGYLGNFVGDYTRSLSYTGNYERNIVKYSTKSSAYSRTSIKNRSSSYGATRNYARTSSRNFTRTSNRNFSGNFTRGFVGNYQRPFNYSRNYLGNYAAAGSFIGNYTRTSTRDFTRTLTYSRTGGTNPYSYLRGAPFGNSYWEIDSYSSDYGGSSDTTTLYFNGYEIDSFQYARTSYVGPIGAGGYYYHIGALMDTDTESTQYYERDIQYYEIAQTVSTTAPAAGGGAGDYTRTGTYSRNYIGNYTRTRSGGTSTRYSTAFYTRTPSYSRTRYSTFTRTSVGSYTGNYVRFYTGNYTGAATTEIYDPELGTSFTVPLAYNRTFAGNYVGEYSRDISYAGNYVRNYQRTRVAGPNYQRTRTQNFTREVPYTKTRSSSYTTDFVGEYAGNYSRNFVGNFIGAATRLESEPDGGGGLIVTNVPDYYARDFIGNYTGNYDRTLNYIGNRNSAYERTRVKVSSYIGAYSRNYSGFFTRETSFNRTSTRNDIQTRVSTFGATYTGNYQRTLVDSYAGNYSRSFTGNYLGPSTRVILEPNAPPDFQRVNYTRNRISAFIGNYTRDVNYGGNFIGDYVRQVEDVYNRNRIAYFTGEYTRDFTRTLYYTGDFARTSTRTRASANASVKSSSYIGSRTSTREFLGNYLLPVNSTSTKIITRTSSFTRTRTSSYTTTSTTYYTGEYIGNYTRNSTFSLGTSEVGFQGERYVAQLRSGSSSSDIAQPRGSVATLAEVEFSVFDNDSGIVYTTTSRILKSNATSHTLKFDFQTVGSSTVAARVYRGSSIIVNNFNLSAGLNTVTVPEAPPQGSTYLYQVKVYNGNDWVNAGLYEVMKLTEVGPTTTTTQDYTATFTPTQTFTQTFTGGTLYTNPNIDQV